MKTKTSLRMETCHCSIFRTIIFLAITFYFDATFAVTFTVNSTGNENDSSIGDGLCSTAGGVCTLRAAITQANSTLSADIVNFNIPGTAPHTITTTTTFVITSQVTIDGTTQPGYVDKPIIEIDGSLCCTANGNREEAFATASDNNVLRGLVINRFSSPNGIGIIFSSDGNRLEGSFIGTDSAGTAALGNGFGILINGSGNIIGGATTSARNLISGNRGDGIQISGGSLSNPSNDNQILGNYIGTDITGTVALGNESHGVGINGFSTNNTVGGPSTQARNLISSNGYHRFGTLNAGVSIVSDGNYVIGNYIGTDYTGTVDLGNASHGIDIQGPASNNSIGGVNLNEGNVIAFNNGIGVSIRDRGFAAIGNAVLSNSIFSNLELGVDLEGDGITQNDIGDSDARANNLQNYPVITYAALTGGSITIDGSINSTANTSFTIQFFSNTECDASGHGEGKTFIKSSIVTTNVTSIAHFSNTFQVNILPGQFITSTATNANNDTSEFSICYELVNTSSGTDIRFIDYFHAGNAGDTWDYVKSDATKVIYTYEDLTGANAGRIKVGNADSGLIYEISGSAVIWHDNLEKDMGMFVPPFTFPIDIPIFQETGQDLVVLRLSSLTVQAGKFNDVIVLVFLDKAFGANPINITLGLDSITASAVTDVYWYAKGVGLIRRLGVESADGSADAEYELLRYNTAQAAPPAGRPLADGGGSTVNIYLLIAVSSFLVSVRTLTKVR